MVSHAASFENINLYTGELGPFPAMLRQGLIKLDRRGEGNHNFLSKTRKKYKPCPKSIFSTFKTYGLESFWNHVWIRLFILS